MNLNLQNIERIIKKRIKNFNINYNSYNEGRIISIYDGIIQISGLNNVMYNEMLELKDNLYAVALNLERYLVGAVVLGSFNKLKEGMKVKCTGNVIKVPVGFKLLGRVVNSLGKPIDGNGPIETNIFSEIEKIAPNVIERKSINKPLQTGYKAIDSMIPIGLGQRELIIGDRQTGKTTLAIDIIINQRKSNIKCIYVAIGQKTSTIVNIVNKLKEYDAMKYTIVVAASASETAMLQYLAPYSGCTMGEYFRDIGENALIIYDDLSKQAVAYRQISLLLRRPPGREAFPGDIFYIHSKLLERSSKVSKKYIEKITKGKIKNRTGSLTAIPIIETQAGDVSAFVPTNVISITDGQIFLESNLFNLGIRPAINPGISVSRVGGSAQKKIIKNLSSGIRTSLAQYNELATFSQFSSDLDKKTKKQLENGKKLTELLKQKQHNLFSIAEQTIIFFAINYKFIEDIKLNKIKKFEKKLLIYIKYNCKDIIKSINKNCNIEDIKLDLIKHIKNFKKNNIF